MDLLALLLQRPPDLDALPGNPLVLLVIVVLLPVVGLVVYKLWRRK